MPLIDSVVGDVRPALLVMLVAVACVLLTVSVNVAGLVLARANARSREFALRIALGARRRRVARQVLTESLLLALLGAVGGLAVARITLLLLVHLAAGELPRLPTARIDGSVLVVTFAVAVLSGLVFGAIPAVRVALADGRGRRVTGGVEGHRLRQVLVTAQVAIAMMLISAAGLMVRSFRHLLATDPGFRVDHTLAVRFAVPSRRYDDTTAARYYATVLDRVRAIPGVRAAGATKVLPLDGGEESWTFGVAGQPFPRPTRAPRASVFHVSANYFQTLGIPILIGREFSARDTLGAPDVIVVNEAFARRYLSRSPEAALAQRLVFREGGSAIGIVGIAGDVHQAGLDAPPVPTIFIAALQDFRSTVTLVVHTRGEPAAMAAAVRQAIWSVDKDQAIGQITTLDDVQSRAVARPRLLSVLLGIFGGFGLLLGALGLYGVVAYTVSQRRAEIGLRVALGAAPRDVVALVSRQGMTMTLLGLAVGVGAALILARGMRAVLFQVTPADPLTYAAVAALLALVALIATYVPARQATRVNPVDALRAE